MEVFSFVKGDDVTVSLNGERLGGINKLSCKKINEYTNIQQFFSSLPVYRYCIKKYVLTFYMEYKEESPFDAENIGNIELVFPYGTEVYGGCCVESIENTVNAKGNAERIIKVVAETRVMK